MASSRRNGQVQRERLVPTGLLALGQALSALHGEGVVHRDVKEANILVRAKDRQPVLVDFGAAGGARPGRVGPLTADSRIAPPRVVNWRAGEEEVEVLIPAELRAGAVLTLRYEWEWKHRGEPALVRTWPLQPLQEEDSSAEVVEFERDFPLLEPAPPELEPEEVPEEEDELTGTLTRKPPVPVQVDAARPELLWVAADATRKELALELFGNGSAVGGFDFEPLAEVPAYEGLPRVAVSVRKFETLRPELLAAMRRALDAQLGTEAAWARAKLGEEHLSESDAQSLTEMGLRWSQRSELASPRGQSYFDHYLALLFPTDTEPDWSALAQLPQFGGICDPCAEL